MASLTEQLAGLATMSPAQLRAEWRRLNKGRPIPVGLGRDMAARAIAWRLQERIRGGLPPAYTRELKRLGQQLRDKDDIDLGKASRIKPGTKLVRQWHGNVYEILVLDDGFQFQDRHFRSLTPIAREITGAAWSGPRFFGLTERPHAPA